MRPIPPTLTPTAESANPQPRGKSHGRVALVGDAAYAPSFFSGQGTSIALVGAYVLAGELACRADHTEAFAAYERLTRPFVKVNQALADDGGRTLAPTTAAGLWLRNRMLRIAPLIARTGLLGRLRPARHHRAGVALLSRPGRPDPMTANLLRAHLRRRVRQLVSSSARQLVSSSVAG
ncbi:hypothetical protein ABGB07_10715 [Micromonosporaceae bacterium B7E4]